MEIVSGTERRNASVGKISPFEEENSPHLIANWILSGVPLPSQDWTDFPGNKKKEKRKKTTEMSNYFGSCVRCRAVEGKNKEWKPALTLCSGRAEV
jgi:hypothetical protein